MRATGCKSFSRNIVLYPAILRVIDKLATAELHAARSGREVMYALAQIAADSRATGTKELATEIETAIDALLGVLPPYAPPLNVMHLVMSRVEEALANDITVAELRRTLADDTERFQVWSESARKQTAHYGSEIIHDGATVFTFTLSETVLRTLREAWMRGRAFSVLVTESRPNNDGLVTVAELAALGVPVSVGVDACIGELVSKADMMIVGAEAIMADGSVVCKVGTYPAALVAQDHSVPVFVVVDTLKLSTTSMFGLPTKMDPLSRSDVLPSNALYESVRVVGHLFDRTPAKLIQSIVTEKGILPAAACTVMMRDMRLSERLTSKLAS